MSESTALRHDLASDAAGLVSICHGLLIHEHLAGLYDVELDEQGRAAVHLRRAVDIIAEINRVHPSPLVEWREPQERVAANCRQFTVLLVALLRAGGMPARARCGFSDYFGTGRWEDHWVAEAWDDTVGSWRLVDAQADDLQRELLSIDLDPLDIPRDRFRVAGDAWALEGIEVLPWDSWGAMPGPSEAIDDRLLDLGDRVHNDVLDGDEAVPL